MKPLVPLTIALGVITNFLAESADFDWKDAVTATMASLKRTCLEQERLSEDAFPGDDAIKTFGIVLELESDQVPYETKCFLRCWLKQIYKLREHFVINKKEGEDPYCEREGRAFANGDECEFAFVYQKCAGFLETTIYFKNTLVDRSEVCTNKYIKIFVIISRLQFVGINSERFMSRLNESIMLSMESEIEF
uniref:Uncharacterized protein n=1 Tax=Glossina brevipalpis TaxID=37001 RepID=A0A1A9WXM6_9MUSC